MASSSSSSSSNSNLDLHHLLQAHQKPKARSQTTHLSIHAPKLLSHAHPLTTLLLGDSMIERLLTTGLSTTLTAASSSPTSHTFNAGVGGDKIENVLYRLELGLFEHFASNPKRKNELKTVVLMVGTNNLHPKRRWREDGIEVVAYKLLLEALIAISCQDESKIFCCEIFERKDIDPSIVEVANGLLKNVIEEINKEFKRERIVWIEKPKEIGAERLVDHVHLDEEGYRIWNEVLCERIGLE